MENTPKLQERENPSCQTSLTSNSSSSNTSSTTCNNGAQTLTTPNMPISMKETNAYPTTFVQADSFKEVVQMLTGSPETTKRAAAARVPGPIKTGPKKSGAFKLYERRNTHKNLKIISPLIPELAQSSSEVFPGRPETLSPSLLDFPSLVLSPMTPSITQTCSSSDAPTSAEEKAIAQKGFYLHPSPISTPRESEPRLLTLFPLTSPRFSAA